MRTWTILSILSLSVATATPLVAQERNAGGDWENAGGYVSGMGGFASATGHTTGDVLVEGGVRVAPHVMVIGNLGYFHNLLTDLQPTLDTTTAALSNNQGLVLNGSGTLPAWYGTGGFRVEIPASKMVLPYVLATAGAARLEPKARFTFASGTLPDGSTPDLGQDVTESIVTAGDFSAPPASYAFMVTIGGGVQIPVASRWVLDAGYRYSRIAADSTLSASPLNTNGMAFGLGYRF